MATHIEAPIDPPVDHASLALDRKIESTYQALEHACRTIQAATGAKLFDCEVTEADSAGNFQMLIKFRGKLSSLNAAIARMSDRPPFNIAH